MIRTAYVSCSHEQSNIYSQRDGVILQSQYKDNGLNTGISVKQTLPECLYSSSILMCMD